MNTKSILCILIMISLICLMTEPVIAGPGGKIATVMFKSFWGRVILIILIIIFLPLIIYNDIILKLSEWRARKDLRFMSNIDLRFEWLNIKERLTDCFTRVHEAWQKENLDNLSGWMADWYIQNQQIVYLNKWKNDGLKNICEVKRIEDISPILFLHRNDKEEHNGSKLVTSIKAYMKDYLVRYEDDEEIELIEGYRDFNYVNTIWTFTLINGKWQVSNIEQAIFDIKYAKLFYKLPKIKDTVLATRKI